MAEITFRDATPSDPLDELNAANPFWIGEEFSRRSHAILPQNVLEIIELDGRTAGVLTVVPSPAANGFRAIATVWVLPEARRQGAGAAAWRRAIAIARTGEGVRGVMIGADDDDAAATAFARAQGLQAGRVHAQSRLALDDRLAEPAAVPGVELRTLPDDATAAAWAEAVATVQRSTLSTPDAADGVDPMPEAIVRAFLPEPWQVMGAFVDGRMIGVTAVLVHNRATREVDILITGVDAAHRGRGIARALKATHARLLRDRGWTSLLTLNIEGNDAILALNREAGFAPDRRRRDWLYDLDGAAVGIQ